MKHIVFLAAVAVLSSLLALSPAKAELSEIEILFIRADANGDLVLSKAEVLRVTIIHFSATDSNRDNALQKKEVGDLSAGAEFSDNDDNGDGALSIEEVIKEKLADFASADKNNDGRLTLEEVEKFYDTAK